MQEEWVILFNTKDILIICYKNATYLRNLYVDLVRVAGSILAANV